MFVNLVDSNSSIWDMDWVKSNETKVLKFKDSLSFYKNDRNFGDKKVIIANEFPKTHALVIFDVNDLRIIQHKNVAVSPISGVICYL